MKFLYLFLFLWLYPFLLYSKPVHLHWEDEPQVDIATQKYRLEVVHIKDGEHHLALVEEITGSSYHWKTELSGLFLMRVIPLRKNAKLIEKPLYWESTHLLQKAIPLYLCDSSLHWQWERIPGKSKYLLRLTERQSASVVQELLLHQNSISLPLEILRPDQEYRLLVLGYNSKGQIELMRDQLLEAKRCSVMPIPLWGESAEGNSEFSYLPELVSRQQEYQDSNGKVVKKTYSGTSWINFAAGINFKQRGKWALSAKALFSSLCSDLEFCQDQIAMRTDIRYRLEKGWRFSSGIEYQNFSLLNMQAFAQDSRQVEDRVHLFTWRIGLIKRLMLNRYLFSLSSHIFYSPWSLSTYGDPSVEQQKMMTGYGIEVGATAYFNSQWRWDFNASASRYSGDSDFLMYRAQSGPAYSF